MKRRSSTSTRCCRCAERAARARRPARRVERVGRGGDDEVVAAERGVPCRGGWGVVPGSSLERADLCGMRHAGDRKRSQELVHGRGALCGADASVVVGLGLGARTPSWSSCGYRTEKKTL